MDIYGIENTVIQIRDKNTFLDIPVPFIAHTLDNFILVKSIDENTVSCVINEQFFEIGINKFKDIWSGIVLLPTVNANSIEPNYKNNHKKDVINKLQNIVLFFCVSALSLGGCLYNKIFLNLNTMLMLALSIAGLFVCLLIVQKQLKFHNGFADRICSIFKTGGCTKTLTSSESKLFGFINLGIVGLSYFIVNILLITLFPRVILYVVLINILTLPFTLWSLWMQFSKLKYWCPLCIIVQIILWLLFSSSLLTGNIIIYEINPLFLLVVCVIYLISFLSLSISIHVIEIARNNIEVQTRYNYLRMQESVFSSELTKERKFSVENVTSIVFGNHYASHHLTILTNPHCNPCAILHDKLDVILAKHGTDISVNYIFTSFGDADKDSAIGLIWIYHNFPIEQCLEAYKKWFEGGKEYSGVFFQKYNVDFADIQSNEEYIRHQDWIKRYAITNTPYAIYDNYKLNEMYDIDDLPNFFNLMTKQN